MKLTISKEGRDALFRRKEELDYADYPMTLELLRFFRGIGEHYWKPGYVLRPEIRDGSARIFTEFEWTNPSLSGKALVGNVTLTETSVQAFGQSWPYRKAYQNEIAKHVTGMERSRVRNRHESVSASVNFRDMGDFDDCVAQLETLVDRLQQSVQGYSAATDSWLSATMRYNRLVHPNDTWRSSWVLTLDTFYA